MHDGYLFTLGVSGTPHGDRPATQLLLAMMAALPPVKRVAAIGDDATLYSAVAADLRDAELLLVITPALEGGLPQRVLQLLDTLAPDAQAGLLHGKVAGLAAVGEPIHTQIALATLQQFCRQAGIDVVTARQYPLIIDAAMQTDAAAAARQAYRFAEHRLPVPSLAKFER